MQIFFALFLSTALYAGTLQEKLDKFHLTRQDWASFVDAEYQKNPDFFSQFWNCLQTGHLNPSVASIGSNYILLDANKHPCFIIKPIDENIYCLNNPNQCMIPLDENRIRPHIPSCKEALTEACCYEIARACDLPVTPPTFLGIFFHPQFFFFSPSCFQENRREKLCSIQQYLPETSSLRALIEETFLLGEQESLPYFDKENFADVQLFIWITYDNDAHANNFRVGAQNTLFKIDNALCFPEQNTQFHNFLMNLPQAHTLLSDSIRQKILFLPIEKITQSLTRFQMQSRIPAFYERIFLLQTLAKDPNVTYYQINDALLNLQTKKQ